MDPLARAAAFAVGADRYDLFMGRYSRPLADLFADAAEVQRGQSALDVGCGPGALTGVLVQRLGAASVAACDPSASFVAACRERYPGVELSAGRAEALPFEAGRFDRVLSQLVFHFVPEPEAALRELIRVARPGATLGACVWDWGGGMELLRHFWRAALEVDPTAPDEARTLRFGREGELGALFATASLQDVTETTLSVSTVYASFDELWAGLCGGVGPAGVYCVSLPPALQEALRAALRRELGAPPGSFELHATARCVTARVPGSRHPGA